MKKNFIFMLKVSLLCLVLIVLLAMSISAETKIPEISISAGSVTGGWFSTCALLAEWANQRVEGSPFSAVPGPGGMGNPIRVGNGEQDVGVSYGDFLRLAREGKDPYEQKYPNLRAMFSLYANYHTFIVDEKFKEETFEDILEQEPTFKLGMGPPGDSGVVLFERILNLKGLSIDTLRSRGWSIQQIDTTGRTDLWKDRHIDGWHGMIPCPNGSVIEAMASRKGRLIGLTESVMDSLVQEFGYTKGEIPPGSYPNQDYSVPVVLMPIVIFTTVDASEEAIYLLTKTVAESEKKFKDSDNTYKFWKPEDMIQGLGIPMHEGALRYYREVGWVK